MGSNPATCHKTQLQMKNKNHIINCSICIYYDNIGAILMKQNLLNSTPFIAAGSFLLKLFSVTIKGWLNCSFPEKRGSEHQQQQQLTLQIPTVNQIQQQQQQRADEIAIIIDKTAPLLNKDPVITIDTVIDNMYSHAFIQVYSKQFMSLNKNVCRL